MAHSSIVARVFYCEHCASQKYRKGDSFLLYHGTSQDFIFHKLKSIPVNGYVPHAFEYRGMNGNNVVVRIHCLMEGCGFERIKSPDSGRIGIKWLRESIIEMPIFRYNALQRFTDTGYELKELC